MSLLNEPFSFNYFGHNIVARSLGPAAVPDVSKITSVHVVPFTSDGTIVAINVINRGWDIPGGHIDEGESSPHDALRREVREEANMTILEPVLIDILAVESATLDLHAKPYMLLYAAEVASLDNFTPNNETSQRLLMTSKMFIDSYFGNKTYAQAMINASAHALLPGATQQGTDERNAVGLPEGKASVSRKTKSTKKKLMILAIAILVLLLNFPLLHMLYVNVKLRAIPLPLSDQVVSMGSNGLGPSGSNISFTLNKRYPSPLAAKEDISRQLTAVGIAAPKATERPTYTFAHDGENSRSDDRIDNIEFIYEMSDGNDYTFTVFFEQPVLCSYDDTTARNLCEGEKKDKLLTAKLANSRPVSSTRVTASVKF